MGRFREVLGSKIDEKSRFLVSLWGMLFETLILVEFRLIFDNIDDEKHIDFWLLCVSFFMFFSVARILKNRAPVEARAQFLQNCIFRAR